eukprot:g5061.t1
MPRVQWKNEVSVVVPPGPFGILLERGPNKRGVVVVGFEPVEDGGKGPLEKHGGIVIGMLLISLDDKKVATMRRSKIAKLLGESLQKEKTLVFAELDPSSSTGDQTDNVKKNGTTDLSNGNQNMQNAKEKEDAEKEMINNDDANMTEKKRKKRKKRKKKSKRNLLESVPSKTNDLNIQSSPISTLPPEKLMEHVPEEVTVVNEIQLPEDQIEEPEVIEEFISVEDEKLVSEETNQNVSTTGQEDRYEDDDFHEEEFDENQENEEWKTAAMGTLTYPETSKLTTEANTYEYDKFENERKLAIEDNDNDVEETEENSMQAMVFDSLPYCTESRDTMELVLGIIRSEKIDIFSRDSDGNTMLQAAVAANCEEVVDVLLNECGATAYDCNNAGTTPLHFASTWQMATLLLNHGADVHAVESEAGCSALHWAAQYNDSNLLELLVSSGAVPTLEDYYGYTPADYARAVDNTENASLLDAFSNENISLDSTASELDKMLERIASRNNWNEEKVRELSETFSSIGLKDVSEIEKALPCMNDLLEMKGCNTFSTSLMSILAQEVAISVANLSAVGQEGNWSTQVDEESGQKYEINNATGESRWLSKWATPKPNGKSFWQDQTDSIYATAADTTASMTTGDGDGGLALTDIEICTRMESDKVSEVVDSVLRNSMKKIQFWDSWNAEPLEQRFISAVSGAEAVQEKLKWDIANLQIDAVKHGVNMTAYRIVQQQASLQNDADASNNSYVGLEELQAKLDTSEGIVKRLRTELQVARDAEAEAAAAVVRVTSSNQNQKQNGALELAKVQAELSSLRAKEACFRQEAIEERNSLQASFEEANKEREKLENILSMEKERLARKEEEVAQKDKEIGLLKTQAVSAAQMLTQKIQEMHASAEKRAAEQVKRMTAEANRKVMRVEAEMKALTARFVKEQALRRKYYNELEDMKGKIRVFCRMRPLLAYETKKKCSLAVQVVDTYSLKLKVRKEWKTFEFDRVFAPKEEQEIVFADTKRLCSSAADGFNVCIFAYGQTGSGKTWTMMGSDEADDGSLLGVAPRSAEEVFSIVDRNKDKFDYIISTSLYEIYRDSLVDLLMDKKKRAERKKKGKKLEPKLDEDGRVEVEGGTIVNCTTAAELRKITEKGMKSRHTGSTKMNDESSRSHMVQMIFIEGKNLATGHVSMGKLTLVDLAGSERADKTGATGDTMKEAQAINRSLSCLGNVISALTTNSKHIPYRDSLLTQLMRDCVGGNAKTLMFVNISPADYNASETFSSLNFAQRCKKVKNKAAASVESIAVKKLKKQLAQLKATKPLENNKVAVQSPASKGAKQPKRPKKKK